VVAAEVVYALRQEFAVTLTDIVHRRLMIGLSADQGVGMSEEIADIAAREKNWNQSEKEQQLSNLREYNARLKPA
jgi:glycerol-3-phosphate dehydrogenase